MSSMFGQYLRLSLFGQSHGEAIGLIMDGFPAGFIIDEALLAREMQRRQGGGDLTTPRREADKVQFVSGVWQGRTTGQPIGMLIRNENMRSEDYGTELDRIRPSHADYTGHVRYFGFEDFRGGGSFSGRLTAPLVAAGELCRQWLAGKGVRIESHIARIGKAADVPIMDCSADEDLSRLRDMRLPVLSMDAGQAMEQEIRSAISEGDSVGGIIEGRVIGLPAGLGAPFFDGVESVLSHLFFSVPAVKGVSFGAGFALSEMRGSEANDPFCLSKDAIVTKRNRAGGLNGGITNGMPVIYRCAFRPTPSISREQDTVSLVRRQEVTLSIHGRHDPCIAVRAVPVMDAMTAIGIMELWKEREACVQ